MNTISDSLLKIGNHITQKEISNFFECRGKYIIDESKIENKESRRQYTIYEFRTIEIIHILKIIETYFYRINEFERTDNSKINIVEEIDLEIIALLKSQSADDLIKKSIEYSHGCREIVKDE